MKKNVNKFTQEVQNIWSLASMLAEGLAAIALIYKAMGNTDFPPKAALAIAGAVLVVNVLTKLYALNRK